MRCISPSKNYSIQVLEGNEEIVHDVRGYAQVVVHRKPVIANFQQGGLLDYEIEAALSSFNFTGLPEGVHPLTRISVFDTEAYIEQDSIPEKDKEGLLVKIDERLRKLQERFPSEFIIVDPPYAARPWPSYDEDTVEDVLKFQERLQINPETIRLYEVENQDRQEIIEAMLRIENPELAAEQFGPARDEEEPITVDA